jgi:hypothetical protein
MRTAWTSTKPTGRTRKVLSNDYSEAGNGNWSRKVTICISLQSGGNFEPLLCIDLDDGAEDIAAHIFIVLGAFRNKVDSLMQRAVSLGQAYLQVRISLSVGGTNIHYLCWSDRTCK